MLLAMPDQELRTKVIAVAMSQDEKARVAETARKKGLQASTWLRAIALQAVKEEEIPQARPA